MAALNGNFGYFDSMGIWSGQKTGAVSLQAMVAAPANPAPATPLIPAIDPVLAAKMAQLQADFSMR